MESDFYYINGALLTMTMKMTMTMTMKRLMYNYLQYSAKL